MINVLHLHTNKKFVKGSWMFYGSAFSNKEIFFSNKEKEISGNSKVRVLPKSRGSILKLRSELAACDIVVVYDLCRFKREIVASIPPNVRVFWRLFGYELYDRKRFDYLSPLSIKAKKPSFRLYPKSFVKSSYRFVQEKIKAIFSTREYSLTDIYSHIDFVMGFCQEEYDHLKSKWPGLPAFIELPIRSYNGSAFSFSKKQNYVVVGNSRSSYNNHFDIIEVIKKVGVNKNLEFKILFNYGPENFYTAKLRDEISRLHNVITIEDFMPMHEFLEFYRDASALVFNGYRQMAMGNIFMAIRNGVKVYLHYSNHIYHWLKSKGFRVYDIRVFENDCLEGNITLSAEIATQNHQAMRNLALRYPVDEFQEKVIMLTGLKE